MNAQRLVKIVWEEIKADPLFFVAMALLVAFQLFVMLVPVFPMAMILVVAAGILAFACAADVVSPPKP